MPEPRHHQLLRASLVALGVSIALSACGDEFVGKDGFATGGAGGAPDDAGGGDRTETAAGGLAAAAGGRDGTSDAGTAGEANADDTPGAGGGVSAPAYEDDVLSEQPLAYWRMGEVEQGVVSDRSGHGNDLVLQGGGHSLHEPGAIHDDDGAIGFDGATSFAIAADARALDFAAGAPFTLECWARRQSGGTSYFQHLLSNVDGVAGNRHGYALYLLPEPDVSESARSVFEYDRPTADLGLWGDVVAESTWGHYVAVFDGGQASFYVNGTLADTKPVVGAFITRTGPFAVARSSGASGSFFRGALDEIAIYPRALDVKAVARHFAFGK